MATSNKWILEGEARGEVKGRVATLLRQVTLKGLGPLSTADLERVQRASIAELDLWSERVLTATSLDELFGP